MFHLFVPSETEKKSDDQEKEWEKKNADLIFLSRIQEPLEDTTEISDEETINTYVFKEGDLVGSGGYVGRIVSGDGSTYTVETSEGHQRPINIKEMFLTTEGEQKAQIEEKISILQAKIDEKNVELEEIKKKEIKRLDLIKNTRKELKAADVDYKSRYRVSPLRLSSRNDRNKILTQLRILLSYSAPDGEDEDVTVEKLLDFKVTDLKELKDEQGAAKSSITSLQRQLTPQQEYLNSLEGVVTTQQQNKLLLEYEGDHPILWTWRKCYDLTFDNMKWKKRPGEVREEKKLLNEYFQTSFEKNKVLYEQYNSGTTDEVNALFIKVSKQMETKRMRIMDQITAANDEVEFIINCLEHFALFQFCELYQRKLREIKMLEKYTGETEKNN